MKLLEDIRPDLDFSKEEKLVDDNLLDSFDILTIVGEINNVFSININVWNIVPENLNSAKAMWELIESFKNK